MDWIVLIGWLRSKDLDLARGKAWKAGVEAIEERDEQLSQEGITTQ